MQKKHQQDKSINKNSLLVRLLLNTNKKIIEAVEKGQDESITRYLIERKQLIKELGKNPSGITKNQEISINNSYEEMLSNIEKRKSLLNKDITNTKKARLTIKKFQMGSQSDRNINNY